MFISGALRLLSYPPKKFNDPCSPNRHRPLPQGKASTESYNSRVLTTTQGGDRNKKHHYLAMCYLCAILDYNQLGK